MRLPQWWRPAWFWSAIAVLVLAGLVTVSVLRGPAHQPESAVAPQSGPHAWDGHTLDGLTTVVTAAGPEGTIVRLVAATVAGSGPCLGVVVSAPSLDLTGGATGNNECDPSVAFVLADSAGIDGVTVGGRWEWQSRRTGHIWFGFFGTTTVGTAVDLRVGADTSVATPVTRHAYISEATTAVPGSRTCVQLVFADFDGATVAQSPVAGDCPPEGGSSLGPLR